MMFPKAQLGRNPAFRELAHGKPCMLRIPGVCCGNPETTVLAHSNQGVHGKGKSLKSGDEFGVWGCYTCHTWLDQGNAGREEKSQAFAVAMDRMEAELLKIAGDVLAKKRDRDAATWALNRLVEFYLS